MEETYLKHSGLLLKETKAMKTRNLIKKPKDEINSYDLLLLNTIENKDLSILYFRLPDVKACIYYDEIIALLRQANSQYQILTIDINKTTLHNKYKISICPTLVILAKNRKPLYVKYPMSIIQLIDFIHKNTNIKLKYDIYQ